ncbi:hypothetical protein WA588_004001 [Blastocystis sp. NMH]
MEHRLGIHIGKLPPSIFVNVPIPLEAYCVDDRDSIFSGNVGEFNVSLVYENHTPVPNADAIFMVNCHNGNGCVSAVQPISFLLKELSCQHQNQRFAIKIEVAKSHVIPCVFSSPFSVVNYKLEIKNSVPENWFKDEGGKKNHITLQVQLTVRIIIQCQY